jgi:hypothetical protein
VIEGPTVIFSSTLPGSRSVQVNANASAFATIVNASDFPAINCTITMGTDIPAIFTSYLTDRNTNGTISGPNPTTSIAANDYSTWAFKIVPTESFETVDVELIYDCLNSEPAAVFVGINTLLLSASQSQPADVVALSATVLNDGIVHIPGRAGTGFFAVASINVGASDSLTVTPRVSKQNLGLELSICETNPATAACLEWPPAASVTTVIDSNATPTYSIFVKGNGDIPLDPAGSRIYVDFADPGGAIRGSTSVAVMTD